MNSSQATAQRSETRSTESGTRNPKEASVGDALRAVYKEAVDEDVPDTMLDLLSKLG